MTNTLLRRSLVVWVIATAAGWTTLVGASLAWSLAHDRYVVDVLAEVAVRSNDPRDAKYRDSDVLGGPLARAELAAHGGAWSLGLLTLGAAALILRKRIQAELETGRREFDRFFGLVPDLVCVSSTDGYFKRIGGSWEHTLGFTQAELLAQPFESFVHPDDVEPTRQEVLRQRGGGTTVNFVNRYRTKAGGYRWLEWVASADVDSSMVYAAARDITDRKQAEAALRKSETELREAQRVARVGSWEWNAQSGAIAWSEELHRLNRTDPASPVPSFEELERFYTPESWARLQAVVGQAFQTGAPYEIELNHIRADGVHIWTSTRGEAVRDGAGPVVGLRGTVLDITEQRATREALRAHETQLQEAQRVAHVGSWDRILKTGAIVWSEELYRMFGLDPTLPVPGFEDLVQFYTPESWARLRAAVEKAVHTGAPFEVEVQIVRPDGSLIHATTRGEAVRDATGRIVGTRGTVLDITDRKRAEEDLSISQQRLALHIKQTPLAVIEFDLEGRVLEWNPAAVHMMGYSRDEAIGQHWTFIVPRTVWDSLDGVWERIVTFRGGGRSTNENHTKDGRTIYCEWFNTPLIDPSGTTIGVASLAMDVTDRKRAEQQIERLTSRLASVIDSMPAMLVGIDRDGRVTQWNRRAEIDTGIPAGDALLKPVVEVLPAFEASIARLLLGLPKLVPISEQEVAVHRNGERRLFDVMLYPLSNDGTREAVVRIEDVTERSRVLEFMIQTEKMLSVGGLAAGIAHEINNPLGIITQAVQNVERRTSLDQPANRDAAARAGTDLDAIRAYHENREIPAFLRDIREAAGRAAHIITNMLEFSRTSETVRAPADLSELLEQSLLLAASDLALRNRYNFRTINIVKEYETGLPTVLVERIEIEQVFLNLVTNAAHALSENPPTRPPQIVLRLSRDEKYAVVQISDNGPGMTPEVVRRVFEPFFTTKPPGVGTGLGLSVAYAIVTQNHKGLIEVESSPDHGACFTIRLPLASGD